jgi:integrase
MRLLAIVGLATGTRRGKILALRWKCVNLDTGRVRVEQSLEQTKAGLRFKGPKTKHGRRQFSVSASVITWPLPLQTQIACGDFWSPQAIRF